MCPGMADHECSIQLRQRTFHIVFLCIAAVVAMEYLYFHLLKISITNVYAPTYEFKLSYGAGTENTKLVNGISDKELCPANIPGLGSIDYINVTEIDIKELRSLYPQVHLGGQYSPLNCTARYRVALIIPYRARENQLGIFLRHLHMFLMMQQLEYGIYIIEQSGTASFNRGKLMNVGYAESQKLSQGDWQCFVFHDIDLLPMDSRNMYSCPLYPRHMSSAVDVFQYKLPYETIFGGVSAMTVAQLRAVNGYSNKFWGWGGEDDDMYNRICMVKCQLERTNTKVGRYIMLKHHHATPNPKRQWILRSNRLRSTSFQEDGLSTLMYDVVAIARHTLYTHIVVDIEF